MTRIFASLVLLFLGAGSAWAQAVYEKPAYNPETKSYFELVRVTQAQQAEYKVGMVPEASWDHAAAFAAGRAFKGAKGRLAIVKSQETHEFIMQHLRPDRPAFIGLRYFCKLRQLRWIDNEVHPANGFKAWAAKWDAGESKFCLESNSSSAWMGVIYTGIGEGFRWVARGSMKNWNLYIVEYPTGHP